MSDNYGTIKEAFEMFHRQNPDVYINMVRLAREWIIKTHGRKLGCKALFERLRWDYNINTSGVEFKLNNNFTAHYAREIMRREPDLAGIFELREQTNSDDPHEGPLGYDEQHPTARPVETEIIPSVVDDPNGQGVMRL